VEAGTSAGDALIYAIENKITVVSAHTNWDAAGVAKALAELLELKEEGFLEPLSADLLKLVVFVPEKSAGNILDAVHGAGAGRMGAYSRCSYRSGGMGSFLASPESRPAVGKPGEASEVREERIEVILKASLRDKVADAILRTHPYETPAFEFYPVSAPGESGFGLVGSWSPKREPLAFVAAKRGLSALNRTRFMPEKAGRVALMPGSGGSYLALAKKAGAELLITGDLAHHDAQAACDLRLGVIGAGHFETENPSVPLLKEKLEKLAPEVSFRAIKSLGPLAVWTKETT
jgi:hypothetical protein